MSVTIETFKLQNPSDYDAQMLVFLPGTIRNTVTAINISNEDRDLNNLRRSLSELKSVTTDILGLDTTITPTTATYMGGYWHYTVENFELTTAQLGDHSFTGSFITPEDSPVQVSQAVFDPSPSGLAFRLSEYEAIENNTIGDRTVGFIFDVDRTTNSLVPSNYQTIISGTATPASFQLSNHSSVGISNSRYAGAKTSITDFGVNSAINAQPINGSIYISSSADTFICSQSDDLRIINELLFSTPDTVPPTEETAYGLYPVSGSRIFNLVGNQVIPIRDKKVWLQENRAIVYVNQDGYAINSGSYCS